MELKLENSVVFELQLIKLEDIFKNPYSIEIIHIPRYVHDQ